MRHHHPPPTARHPPAPTARHPPASESSPPDLDALAATVPEGHPFAVAAPVSAADAEVAARRIAASRGPARSRLE